MGKMTRRQLREHLLKLLYLREFHDLEEFDEQFGLYFENFTDYEEGSEEIVEIRERFDKMIPYLAEIDKIIENAACGWKFNRIGKIELMLLRIALFEIKYDESVPDKAAINEAVELSKQYGSDDKSYGFVNGVLGQYVNSADRV
ncbi:MAG: transcription antitermination factor NusB [Lachnospiraceae bacterium]|nr:transcription antitermination factor NusB [Lachnospiraceae bacterium]